MIMNKYISAYEFAKKNNMSAQKVYRLIREGKIKDYRKDIIEFERIRINENETI